jgi:hypothetical protein
LISQKAMNQVVSHIDGVKLAVHAEAEIAGARAEANLARHRKTGQAKITVTQGDVDSFVNLDDPDAMSIEFGHWVKGKYERSQPKFVPGLYIITEAAGLLN